MEAIARQIKENNKAGTEAVAGNTAALPVTEQPIILFADRINAKSLAEIVDVAGRIVSSLSQHDIYLDIQEDQIVEALCIITDTPIDFTKASEEALQYMIQELKLIIGHPGFEDHHGFLSIAGSEALRDIATTTAAMRQDLTYRNRKLVTAIKSHQTKEVRNITKWIRIATTFGIFLPNKALEPKEKQSLVYRALKYLKTASIKDLVFDEYSLALLANYTGVYEAAEGIFPGILGDFGIPIEQRTHLAKRYN